MVLSTFPNMLPLLASLMTAPSSGGREKMHPFTVPLVALVMESLIWPTVLPLGPDGEYICGGQTESSRAST